MGVRPYQRASLLLLRFSPCALSLDAMLGDVFLDIPLELCGVSVSTQVRLEMVVQRGNRNLSFDDNSGYFDWVWLLCRFRKVGQRK